MTNTATVLLVDDEQDILDLYASWLSNTFDVRTASTGVEAIEQLTPEIDVVLLDRRMPNLTGDQVLDEIRDHGIDCRVAMVTAVEPDIDVIELGFDEYLTKPINKSEVIGVVQRLAELQYHDELLQEYFALASKITTLETNIDEETLATNVEYNDIVERFSAVKNDARNKLNQLITQEDNVEVFRRLMTGWMPDPDHPTEPASSGGDDD